jgi:hypothetical protein
MSGPHCIVAIALVAIWRVIFGDRFGSQRATALIISSNLFVKVLRIRLVERIACESKKQSINF